MDYLLVISLLIDMCIRVYEVCEELTKKSCSAYSNTMYIDLSSSITSLKATKFR